MPEYPKELDPSLAEILGMQNFQVCPIAHAMRDDGADIPRKVEAEQAHVTHWMIGLYLEHGDQWRGPAAAELDKITQRLKSAQETT